MKKINSNLLSAMLISLAVLYGCRKESAPDQEYEKLKKMSYSSMSNSEKVTLQKGLVERMRSDPDFIAANKLLADQTSAILDAAKQRRAKGLKRAEINKNLSQTDQLRARGIKDPKKFQKNRILMMVKMAAVMKKFPEYKKLDKGAKKQILKEASVKKR